MATKKSNIEITHDSDLVIQSYIEGVISKFDKNYEWTSDNSLSFKKNNTEIGKITLDDRKIIAEGEEVIKTIQTLIKHMKKIEEQKLTEENTRKTTMSDIVQNDTYYNGLKSNPIIFQKLEKDFKSLNIDKIIIGNDIGRNKSVYEKITLGINMNVTDYVKGFDSGYQTRLKTILMKHFDHDAQETRDFNSVSGNGILELLEKEKTIDVKLPLSTRSDPVVGKYFPERNFIQLYYNPFKVKRILPLMSEYSPILSKTLEALKMLKLKVNNIDKLKNKLFISGFLQNIRNRFNSIDGLSKETERNIKGYENSLRDNIFKLNEYRMEKEFLQNTLQSNGESILKELEKTKELEFLTNIKLGTADVTFSFKETTITAKNFRKNAKNFGKRILYLGPISITVSPVNFLVSNPYNIRTSNPHPHAGSDGSPCFGSGDGRNKIYEMLASNKFSELAKLLWFWIKTYIDEGAHVGFVDMYNDRLKKGLPVWDDKGKRISINEKSRLDSGEQTLLNKDSIYAENIKKFENFKLSK